MRYQFIDAEKANYPVVILCRVLKVSRSGYYSWATRGPSRREQANAALLAKVRAIHKQSRSTYGSPRIFEALRAQGMKVSENRIARLMRTNEIRSCHRRVYRVTTNSKHSHPIAPNLVNRCFTASAPDQIWAGDITYIPTDEGWLYLAVILDLFSRRVIGWSMGERLHGKLTEAALELALSRRQTTAQLLHHSDRGVQYAAKSYQDKLSAFDITCSMSRKGDCWDNAVAESFFKTLKVECVDRFRFRTREEARRVIFDYIEVFYNRQRLHSYLGYRSPVDYEAMALAA